MQETSNGNQIPSKFFVEEYFQAHSLLIPNGKIFKITRTRNMTLIADVSVRNFVFLEFVGIQRELITEISHH